MYKSKIESIKIYSEFLGKEMKTLIYLPENYNELEKFPVLYFIHGRSGSESILYETGLNTIADHMIHSGKIEPLIIVCPCMDNSQGMNSSEVYKVVEDPGDSNREIHLGRYEDYFIYELIKVVEEKYSIVNNKSSRYIGGISAGGYAALHYTFHYQHLFSKVGGHMPAIEIALEDEDRPYYSSQSMWDKYDPITIAKNNNIENVDVYLDCGDEDDGGFYRGCEILNNILKEKNVKTQYHLNRGRHNHEYIKGNICEYLNFYSGKMKNI